VRILIIDTCYPAFLERHYAARPSLRAASYGDQWRALMDTFFGTADAYSHNLRALGHDAHEVVANCVPLQHAWAREHGHTRDIRGVSPEESIVVEQARAFEPDVVYVQHVHFLSDEALMRLKEISGFLVGQIATEPPRASRLRRFDLLVTCLPPFAERFRAQGVPTELLRLGFDERALTRVEATGAERLTAMSHVMTAIGIGWGITWLAYASDYSRFVPRTVPRSRLFNVHSRRPINSPSFNQNRYSNQNNQNDSRNWGS